MDDELYFYKNSSKIIHNAFYLPANLKYYDRTGLQSDENDGFYIYEWDERLGKHVKIWVNKEDL